MKKTYMLEDLDCANCAAKLEKAISSLDGVNRVSVSFLAQKVMLDIADEKVQAIANELPGIVKKTVPGCKIIMK